MVVQRASLHHSLHSHAYLSPHTHSMITPSTLSTTRLLFRSSALPLFLSSSHPLILSSSLLFFSFFLREGAAGHELYVWHGSSASDEQPRIAASA